MKKGFILLIILLLVGSLVACEQSKSAEKPTTKAPQEEFTGTITAAGSTALQPLAKRAAAEFMTQHANVSIAVEGGGSGVGMEKVADGSVQIGNSDLPVFEHVELNTTEFVDHKVAAIAFVIVVNESVTIDNLTGQQVQDIFSGKVQNWNLVGGSDQQIHVINRPKSSGTRAIFEKTLLEGGVANESIGTIQESNAAVEQSIHSLPGAIGYLAMPYVVGKENRALKIVQLDGAEAKLDNIINGKYPFWAYQYMVTKGEATGTIKEYIDYVAGEEFERVVEEMGYIPMTKLSK